MFFGRQPPDCASLEIALRQIDWVNPDLGREQVEDITAREGGSIRAFIEEGSTPERSFDPFGRITEKLEHRRSNQEMGGPAAVGIGTGGEPRKVPFGTSKLS